MADRTVMEAHGRARRAMGVDSLTRTGLRRFGAAMFLSKEIWIIYASALLCGRASLGSGIYPFGIALFWTVARSGQRTHAVGAFLGVVVGLATVAPIHRWLAVLVVLLGGLFLEIGQGSERPKERVRRLWRQAFLVAAGHVVARFVFAHVFEESAGNLLWIVLEAVLVMTAIVIWGPLSALWRREARIHLSREAWVGIALFSVMLSLGLAGIQSGPLIPSELWNRLITLTGAYIGGATTGAAVGTALGWVMGMHGTLPLGGAMVYALSGLLGGLFSARGKVRVGMGFLLGHLLLSIQTASPVEIVYSLIHALLALALLVILPNGWLRSLERALPGSRARERFVQVREERLRHAVSERLAKMGGLLAEMGRTFAVAGTTHAQSGEDENPIAPIVEQVTLRLCHKCPGYRKCWEEHMYQTYKEVVDFVREGQERGELRDADMPLALRQRCLKTSQFTQTLHGILIEREERLRWQARLEGQLNVVPAQLHGVASLLEGLADQVRVETGGSDEVQVTLADALYEERIPVSNVEVRARGSMGRFEIWIERDTPCDRIGLWREQVTRVVTATLRDQYIVWRETCDVDGKCTLQFVLQPPYHIGHAALSIPKQDGVSGDTFHSVDLVDGRVAMILSDGMGSGVHAAMQSESAAQLLGTLLETGFDLRSAVRSVNSLLLMRSAEETFATLDAVVIDQFTGEAEFLKVGSAPSFIVRGSDVTVVRSSALPVGIVSHVDARVQRRHLQPGDMIVLLTDGLLDSVAVGSEPEEWLARILQDVDHETPRKMLEAVMKRVSEVADGEWDDDVTVAVVRYERRQAEAAEGVIPEYQRLSEAG